MLQNLPVCPCSNIQKRFSIPQVWTWQPTWGHTLAAAITCSYSFSLRCSIIRYFKLFPDVDCLFCELWLRHFFQNFIDFLRGSSLIVVYYLFMIGVVQKVSYVNKNRKAKKGYWPSLLCQFAHAAAELPVLFVNWNIQVLFVSVIFMTSSNGLKEIFSSIMLITTFMVSFRRWTA